MDNSNQISSFSIRNQMSLTNLKNHRFLTFLIRIIQPVVNSPVVLAIKELMILLIPSKVQILTWIRLGKLLNSMIIQRPFCLRIVFKVAQVQGLPSRLWKVQLCSFLKKLGRTLCFLIIKRLLRQQLAITTQAQPCQEWYNTLT